MVRAIPVKIYITRQEGTFKMDQAPSEVCQEKKQLFITFLYFA